MRYILSHSARRRLSKWFAAMAVPVSGLGCTMTAPNDKPAAACYDVFGRPAPTIITKAECDFYKWQWR